MSDDEYMRARVRKLEDRVTSIEAAQKARTALIKAVLREGPKLFALFVGACFVIYEIKKMDPRL